MSGVARIDVLDRPTSQTLGGQGGLWGCSRSPPHSTRTDADGASAEYHIRVARRAYATCTPITRYQPQMVSSNPSCHPAWPIANDPAHDDQHRRSSRQRQHHVVEGPGNRSQRAMRRVSTRSTCPQPSRQIGAGLASAAYGDARSRTWHGIGSTSWERRLALWLEHDGLATRTHTLDVHARPTSPGIGHSRRARWW